MKVVMTFEIPEDERFLKGEITMLAHRMFEVAQNVCVDPFISEELFETSSLEIDGHKSGSGGGTFTIVTGLGESDPVPYDADSKAAQAAFDQAMKRHDEEMRRREQRS